MFKITGFNCHDGKQKESQSVLLEKVQLHPEHQHVVLFVFSGLFEITGKTGVITKIKLKVLFHFVWQSLHSKPTCTEAASCVYLF